MNANHPQPQPSFSAIKRASPTVERFSGFTRRWRLLRHDATAAVAAAGIQTNPLQSPADKTRSRYKTFVNSYNKIFSNMHESYCLLFNKYVGVVDFLALLECLSCDYMCIYFTPTCRIIRIWSLSFKQYSVSLDHNLDLMWQSKSNCYTTSGTYWYTSVNVNIFDRIFCTTCYLRKAFTQKAKFLLNKLNLSKLQCGSKKHPRHF